MYEHNLWSNLLLNVLSGFSLNGELMMDRMGQEIAFKGIDTSEPFVAIISLGPGQRARLNFGQVRLLGSSNLATVNYFFHDTKYWYAI